MTTAGMSIRGKSRLSGLLWAPLASTKAVTEPEGNAVIDQQPVGFGTRGAHPLRKLEAGDAQGREAVAPFCYRGLQKHREERLESHAPSEGHEEKRGHQQGHGAEQNEKDGIPRPLTTPRYDPMAREEGGQPVLQSRTRQLRGRWVRTREPRLLQEDKDQNG